MRICLEYRLEPSFMHGMAVQVQTINELVDWIPRWWETAGEVNWDE